MDSIYRGTSRSAINNVLIQSGFNNTIEELPELDQVNYEEYDFKNCENSFLVIPIPLSSFYDSTENVNFYSNTTNFRAIPEYKYERNVYSQITQYPDYNINLNGITCFNIYIYMTCLYF